MKITNKITQFPVTIRTYTNRVRWSSIQQTWVTEKVYNNNAKLVIKSVGIKQKNKNKFTFTMNYKTKYSNSNTKLDYKLIFYNFDGSRTYTYTLTEKNVKKGTQTNKSTNYTLTLPSWAMNYYFY